MANRKDPREYGYEGEMAMSQLKGILMHAKQLHDKLEPDTDLPEWVQSKITLAYDYIQTAADYMATEMSESKEFYADAKKRATAGTPQEKLSPAWKAKAKARASSAGRKYPNLVDNVWAARMQESVSMDEAMDNTNKNRKIASKAGSKLSIDPDTKTPDYFTAAMRRKKGLPEEAPANSVSGGKIAGMGVGPQGEPGVMPKALKRYKDKNAAEAPSPIIGGMERRKFSQFMLGK